MTAASLTAADRLRDLEWRIATWTQHVREDAANRRARAAVSERQRDRTRQMLAEVEAEAFESALFWLLDGDGASRRRQVDSWAALDFWPALQSYAATLGSLLDPERDTDWTPGEAERMRARLAVARELLAEHDRDGDAS